MTKVSEKISFGGIDKQVESRLSFKPSKDHLNGICIATLDSVELVEHEVAMQLEDGTPSAWEFAGKKIYSLEFTFIQKNFDPKDASVRYLTHRETMVSSSDKNGSPIAIKTWHSLVTSQFARLQHIVNALDKAKIAPLSKDITNIDLDFNATPEVRINTMKKVYEHFLAQIKGKGETPKYNNLSFYLRVIADPTRGTYYKLPDFVQKGFIEVAVKGCLPTIELAPSDSIELVKKATKAAKANADYHDTDANRGGDDAGASAEDVLSKLGLA